MRYLGLDLGTKTLGIAISDKTNTIANMLKVVRFKKEEYEVPLKEVALIVKEYNISKIALGLPKNMNNSYGFASERSLKFKEELEKLVDIPIILIDERLTSVLADNILLEANMRREKRKEIIDGIAAEIILETLLRKEAKENE